MDFIQFGGLEILEKALRVHAKDDMISFSVPPFLRYVIAVGARASISEINSEAVGLQLCHRCSEALERAKKPLHSFSHPSSSSALGGGAVKVPRPCDRINRVLKFAENYLTREDVMVASLDATIAFANNPDTARTVRETPVVAVLGKVYAAHTKNPVVLWRVCLTLSILLRLSEELARDISLLELHEPLVGSFDSLKEHPITQQQILNFLSVYLLWTKTKYCLQKSQVCMDFLSKIVNSENERRAADAAIVSFHKVT
jgi:hypothetical protein